MGLVYAIGTERKDDTQRKKCSMKMSGGTWAGLSIQGNDNEVLYADELL